MARKVGHKAAPATKTVPPPPKTARPTFVFAPTARWATALAPLAPGPALPAPTPAQLAALAHKAEALHAADVALYTAATAADASGKPAGAAGLVPGGPSPADAAFLTQILAHGTLADRLSALTLLVQGSPVHNTKALETLRTLAERGRGKGGREESLKAVRCVVDWWVGGGGADRKLRYFRDQPLLHPAATDAHLVLWHYEDWLKKFFFSFLQVLETLALDPLPYVRTQVLSFLASLLVANPEQEHNLLRLLAHKLGDADRPVASRASHHLLAVLQRHPAMKAVVVREVAGLVLRPVNPTAATAVVGAHIKFLDDENAPTKRKGAKEKGKGKEKEKEKEKPKDGGASHLRYYAAITFNQIMLLPTPQDREVARKLLDVYFEMFREILGEGVEKEKKDADAAKADADVDVDVGKGKIKHKGKDGKEGKDGKGSKGKEREKQVAGAAGFAEVEDAESRLVSAILTGINRALPYAKVDVGDPVFNKHVDTLFLITHTSTFNTSLQALLLLLHICAALAAQPQSSSSATATTKSITDRYFRALYASLHDPRLPRSSKHAMYLNLLFRSLKLPLAKGNEHAKSNAETVKAFVRRFVQVLVAGTAGAGGSEFVAGGLFLLGELFNTTPGLREMLTSPPAPTMPGEEEEAYDPKKRDPQHAHASASPLWELLPLLRHYHPTVALHAQQLLAGAPLTATPDLALNTLAHFLDRFVYKNPKRARARGSSAMQPAAAALGGAGGTVSRVRGEVRGRTGGTVREESFVGRRREEVDVSEVFFHRYFAKKKEKEEARKGKVGKRRGDASDEEDDDEDDDEEGDGDRASEAGATEDDEDEGGSEDEEEKEIWKAMKASMPQVDADLDLMEDSDEDAIPSGLDDMPDDSGEDDAVSGEDNDEDSKDDSDDDEVDAEANDDDAFSLAEASDAEDLVDLDADLPMGLVEYDGSDDPGSDEDQEPDVDEMSAPVGKKRKRVDERRERRKKLRSLPTFASYEDYAKLIEGEPEDNI